MVLAGRRRSELRTSEISELEAPVILVLFPAAIKLRSSPRTIQALYTVQGFGTTEHPIGYSLKIY